MKVTTIIDENREEEIVIYLREKNSLPEEIEVLLEKKSTSFIGYSDREIITLLPKEVVCFLTEDNKVYALTDSERLRMKKRLYEIEGELDSNFVRISQSCIANISKIKKFDVSLGGALRVEFKNGYRDYVSRRQVKAVKERLGIK